MVETSRSPRTTNDDERDKGCNNMNNARVAQPRHFRTVAGHLADMREEGKLQLRVEPRCRTCADPQVRELVNMLLSHGHSYPSILRVLGPVNAARPANSQITRDSLFKHAKRHFPLQAPAREVYRRILERRAAESDADYENGVATLVTAASYFEIMMTKGFATLVDEDTVVSVDQGAQAALKFHELTRGEAGAQRMAELAAEMNRIVAAVREIVPERYHPAILARINGQPVPMDGHIEDAEDDVASPVQVPV